MRLACLRLGSALLLLPAFLFAADAKPLSTYFPPAEDQGGWRTLLPQSGEPSADQKSKIRQLAGCDWDKLNEA